MNFLTFEFSLPFFLLYYIFIHYITQWVLFVLANSLANQIPNQIQQDQMFALAEVKVTVSFTDDTLKLAGVQIVAAQVVSKKQLQGEIREFSY